MSRRLPLLKGTLDLLILKTLSLGASHGFGIVQTIEETTEGVFFVEEGSLYPALHRLQRKGLVKSRWGISELRRRAKFYELTKRGTAQLGRETADWEVIRDSVGKVLALGTGRR
ncbi:MAG: PadR family transcriptional regulator [Gemmatimonadetes bacterium]|nr:PadR family transcriptional regulator [Gemmatimonadota bacterium]